MKWRTGRLFLYSLDTPSESILKLEMSSPEMLLPSAPTPRPRGPMAEVRRRSWISSEIISRFLRAVLYSPFAWNSLTCLSSTVFFRFWGKKIYINRRFWVSLQKDENLECCFSVLRKVWQFRSLLLRGGSFVFCCRLELELTTAAVLSKGETHKHFRTTSWKFNIFKCKRLLM